MAMNEKCEKCPHYSECLMREALLEMIKKHRREYPGR